MEKHCGSKKRFGKEGNGTDAGSANLESFIKASDKKAHSFAYSLCGNSEEAKELVQEAFYRVARAWDKFDASKPLESWFFSILKNAFIDSRKRAERQHGVSLDWPMHDEDGSCLGDMLRSDEENLIASLERAEAAGAVRRALKRVSEKHQAVLRRCDMDGWTYDDTARSLGVSVGTVRSRIVRARQALLRRSPELAAVA